MWVIPWVHILYSNKMAAAADASRLGRLLEKRIQTRFKVHGPTIELLDETTLVQAYGDCCFGIDHFFRFGSKQIHVQDKWETHAPKLRDLRHFVVASNALTAKLPLLEPPLRIFLSRRRITAPESLFVLQASHTESLSEFTDIETATESLYERVCQHFHIEMKPLTPELLEEFAAITTEILQEGVQQHRLIVPITASLKVFGDQTVPPLLNQLYGNHVAQDIIAHVQDLAAHNQIGTILRFFKTRRATPLEYDIWIAVLYALRSIQLNMEQVNAETGRRIYSRSEIGEPAIPPTEQEQLIERTRLFNRNRKKAIVTVIKENPNPEEAEHS